MNTKLLFIAFVGVIVILAVIIYYATSSVPAEDNTPTNTNTPNTNTPNTNTNTPNTNTPNTNTPNTNTNTPDTNTNTPNTNTNTPNTNTNTNSGNTVACVKATNGQAIPLQQAYNMVNSSSSLAFGTNTQMARLATEGVTWCNYMWMVNANRTSAIRGPDLLRSGFPFSAGMPSTYVTGSSTEWPGCGVNGQIGIFYINDNLSVSTAGVARYHTFISVSGNKTEAEINSLLPTGYAVAKGQLAPTTGGTNNSLLRYLS